MDMIIIHMYFTWMTLYRYTKLECDSFDNHETVPNYLIVYDKPLL